jgi:hypothetical protein
MGASAAAHDTRIAFENVADGGPLLGVTFGGRGRAFSDARFE